MAEGTLVRIRVLGVCQHQNCVSTFWYRFNTWTGDPEGPWLLDECCVAWAAMHEQNWLGLMVDDYVLSGLSCFPVGAGPGYIPGWITKDLPGNVAGDAAPQGVTRHIVEYTDAANVRTQGGLHLPGLHLAGLDANTGKLTGGERQAVNDFADTLSDVIPSALGDMEHVVKDKANITHRVIAAQCSPDVGTLRSRKTRGMLIG